MSADSPSVDLVYMLEGSENEGSSRASLKQLTRPIGELYLESYHLVHLAEVFGKERHDTRRQSRKRHSHSKPEAVPSTLFKSIAILLAILQRGTAPDFRGAIASLQIPLRVSISSAHLHLQ